MSQSKQDTFSSSYIPQQRAGHNRRLAPKFPCYYSGVNGLITRYEKNIQEIQWER